MAVSLLWIADGRHNTCTYPFPLGLYDMNRNIRPVGTAYKEIIKEWQTVLPTQSICLQLPVVTPKQQVTRTAAKAV